MCKHMPIHSTFVSTAMGTVRTFERLFSCVSSDVSSEVTLHTKPCWTQVTGIRFFSSMSSHVKSYLMLVGSTEWTVRATVRLVSFVDFNVFLELALWQFLWTIRALNKCLTSGKGDPRCWCFCRSKCGSRIIAASRCHLQETFRVTFYEKKSLNTLHTQHLYGPFVPFYIWIHMHTEII